MGKEALQQLFTSAAPLAQHGPLAAATCIACLAALHTAAACIARSKPWASHRALAHAKKGEINSLWPAGIQKAIEHLLGSTAQP